MKTSCCRLTVLVGGLLTAVSTAAVLPAGDSVLKPTAADNAALVEHLKRAFDEGFVIGPKRLQEAQKHLAQARRLAPDEPRIDYALGLVLVKQSQIKQAIAQFEGAIERDDLPYWPAWQAAIWTQLADKRYEPGLKRLVEFATIVRGSEKPDDVSEAQRDAARWIGQVIVALSYTDDSKRLDELLAAHANDILKALGDDLWDELEDGRDSIAAREFALGQAAGKTRQTADKKDQLRKERKAALLDKNIEGAGKAKENNEKSKEDWKAWLDDELAHLDKTLGGLERDYKFLDQRALSLTQSINLVGQELTAMDLALGMTNLRNANPLAMQNAQQQYLQRQNQLLSYQLDYNTTVGRMSEVAQAGAVAADERAGVIAQYEKATGELIKKSAGLDKWSARLKDQKQKLTVNKPAAKGGKSGTGDKKAVPPTFKTILPFDPQGERDRLLASFGAPSAGAKVNGADQ